MRSEQWKASLTPTGRAALATYGDDPADTVASSQGSPTGATSALPKGVKGDRARTPPVREEEVVDVDVPAAVCLIHRVGAWVPWRWEFVREVVGANSLRLEREP